MPIGSLFNQDFHIDFVTSGSSVTSISMESFETNSNHFVKGAGSYDENERRSSFSSDVSFKEFLETKNTDRSSFTTVEDQYDYFKSDNGDSSLQSIVRDMDKISINSSTPAFSPKLNSSMISLDSDKTSFNVDNKPDQSFLSLLKAVSVDAYEPPSTSNQFISPRKVASEDAYDTFRLVDSKGFTTVNASKYGFRAESPPYVINSTPQTITPRRESYPITQSIQSRNGFTAATGQITDRLTTSPVQGSSSTSVQWPNSAQPVPQQLNLSLPYDRQTINDASQAPRQLQTNHMVYQVQFKRKVRHFVLPPNSVLDVGIDDYVKVEADRGEDLGVVLGIISVPTFLEQRRQHHLYNTGAKDEDGAWDLKQILRHASTYERRQLAIKAQEEAMVAQNAYDIAINVYGLPMNIVDAEFQFDRHKLVIFYESTKRIDFREFVRDLFALYKTRIWMQQVDGPVNPVMQTIRPAANPYQVLPPHGGNAGFKGRLTEGIATSHNGYRPNVSQYGQPGNRMMQYQEPIYLNQTYVDPSVGQMPRIPREYDERLYDTSSVPYASSYMYSGMGMGYGQNSAGDSGSYPL